MIEVLRYYFPAISLFIGLLFCQSSVQAEPVSFPVQTIVFRAGQMNSVSLPVEVAITKQQRQQGLMGRRNWPQVRGSQGMLFVMPYSRIIQMWMKNTWVALDMVFFDCQKRINQIVRNRRPLSLQIITSPPRSCYVLELPAGGAQELQLQLQDIMTWPENGVANSS